MGEVSSLTRNQLESIDLWISPSENIQRVRDAGVEDGVFPIHADARSLPFAEGFFDAVVSIDSFLYYGNDDLYLNSHARFDYSTCFKSSRASSAEGVSPKLSMISRRRLLAVGLSPDFTKTFARLNFLAASVIAA
jgi:hypothetical protein